MTDKKQAWTKEPWEEGELDRNDQRQIVSESGQLIIVCAHECIGANEPIMEANAARIVACVNALAGIPHPAEWRQAVERLLEIAEGLAVAVDMSRAYERSDEVAVAYDVWQHNYNAFLALQSPPAEERDDDR